jgi:hypothetical protein
MKRLLLAAMVLGGCSSASTRLETDQLRISSADPGTEIAVRRAGGWSVVARLPGIRLSPFSIDGPRLLVPLRQRVEVDVPGPKTMALFPGLEFLEGDEVSSSDRDVKGPSADRRRPERWKITVPLMAFEVDGALVALLWRGSARPFFEARERNVMSIEPDGGDFEGVLLVEPGASIYDAVPRWTSLYGLPEPEPWPRSLEEELALCKAGFASVSAPRGKHRHAMGNDWPPDWTPGFGVLLHLLGEKVDWFDYSDLLSSVNCHILRWEAPFYAGEPETAKKLLERLKLVTDMRQPEDGEWGFHPMNAEQRKLGAAGDSVLGTSAEKAYSIAKAARMTGDAELKAIALDVLGRLRRHKVPRGGQNWECPLYEPDLLAAAFAVGAYVEAWKLSGDRAWLADAARWAKSGLPFLYLWEFPGRKGMRYASIPVFGTTQFTQPWFGVPVQWNGLVFAYFLRKLAPHEKSVDWRRVADGITSSAVQQQYAAGPSKGCYPDGFHDQCSRRAPPDINPEDILVNILTSIGKDPDPDLSVPVPATHKR